MNYSNSSSSGYEYNPLVAKYEELRQQHKSFYLDPYEFIEIANFYLNQLDYEKAKEALYNGLKIHRKNSSLLIELAHLYLELDDLENVKEILNQLNGIQLFEVDTIRAEVLLAEDENDEKAQQILSLSVDPTDLDQNLNTAQLFLVYQFPDRALSWLLPAYEKNRENTEVLELLARTYLMKLDFTNAAKIYDELHNFVPYQSEYWNKLAHCYYLTEDFEAAEEAYSFAITCEKENDEAYVFGALSLLYIGKEKEARKLFDKGIKEGILFLEHKHYYLALFYYTQLEEVEKAYSELLKGIENIRRENGYYVLCYYFLFTICLIRLDKFTEAKKCCSEALHLYEILPTKNIENHWAVLPSAKKFKELEIICNQQSYSVPKLFTEYTHQLISYLNPILWSDGGNPLLLMDTDPLSDYYKPIKLSTLINKNLESHNLLDKVYFEMLLESEQVLTESIANPLDLEIKNDSLIKNLIDNNPNLVAAWKIDIKKMTLNN